MRTITTRDTGSWIFIIAIVAVAAFIFLRPTPQAPKPALFTSGASSLDAAIDRAEDTGKVVFAFATADWCGPCQTFKKGALADPRVAEWVEQNAEPVYIDVDASPSDAQRLGVRGIPASYVLKDGEIVNATSGVQGAGAFLDWLEQSKAAALAQR